MSVRFQADADLNHIIVKATLRREPSIDFQTAHVAGLVGVPDPEVLALAAHAGRILVTHDRKTMPTHFAAFIGHTTSSGVIIIPQKLPIRVAVEDLLLIWTASEAEEVVMPSKESSVPELQTLMSGLAFGESPRWHEDRLWFSDWGAHEVIAVDPEGKSAVIVRVPSFPMCIDFLPDGRLLIVSASDGLLLRREADGSLVTHADLSGLANHKWNDIVVDGRGNAYVNNVGFDFPGGEFAPGILALVTRDGSARQVAEGVAFPNGMVVTPDNSTLILAESYGNRLTAFDIAADGGLSNRRVWADLQGGVPDGICLDAENAIWYGDVPNKRCVRVREGGEVLQAIHLDRGCFACMLGGADRRTLFLIATAWRGPANMVDGSRTGQVLIVEAPAPGVGWP